MSDAEWLFAYLIAMEKLIRKAKKHFQHRLIYTSLFEIAEICPLK